MTWISAKEYAEETKRPERTVRGWAERGKVPGAKQFGTAWGAPRKAWEEAAQTIGKQGRRNSDSREKKKDPDQQ